MYWKVTPGMKSIASRILLKSRAQSKRITPTIFNNNDKDSDDVNNWNKRTESDSVTNKIPLKITDKMT